MMSPTRNFLLLSLLCFWDNVRLCKTSCRWISDENDVLKQKQLFEWQCFVQGREGFCFATGSCTDFMHTLKSLKDNTDSVRNTSFTQPGQKLTNPQQI